MSTDLAPDAKRYNLFTTEGSRKLVWRLADEGVALEPDGIAVMRAGQWTRAHYTDIAAITLTSGAIGQSGLRGACTIRLNNLALIVVNNLNARGIADGFRDGIFRQFVGDLHNRLIETGTAKDIYFHAGFSQSRMTGLVVITIIAALLFVVLPFGLLIFTRDIQTLWMLLAGAGLVYPIVRVTRNNQPATYLPTAPPDVLR